MNEIQKIDKCYFTTKMQNIYCLVVLTNEKQILSKNVNVEPTVLSVTKQSQIKVSSPVIQLNL